MTDKEETNREGRKEREGRRKKEDLFTRQLVLDRLLVLVECEIQSRAGKPSPYSLGDEKLYLIAAGSAVTV